MCPTICIGIPRRTSQKLSYDITLSPLLEDLHFCPISTPPRFVSVGFWSPHALSQAAGPGDSSGPIHPAEYDSNPEITTQ